ncbi:porin, partial [Escherichia coli]|nr:porin [Escherichia coli]
AALNGLPDDEVRMLNSNSRLGVRGVEDLGGGLKAIFNLEHRMNADDGNSTAPNFWQHSWVGLSGNFGEVRLGRDYAPAFYVALA